MNAAIQYWPPEKKALVKKCFKWSMIGVPRGTPGGGYDQNTHLYVTMLLMYYCGFTLTEVLGLYVSNVEPDTDGSARGYYPGDDRADYETYCIGPKILGEVNKHIQKHRLGPKDKLIPVDERSVRKVFEKITAFYGVPFQLTDIRMAGWAASDGWVHKDFPFWVRDYDADPYDENSPEFPSVIFER